MQPRLPRGVWWEGQGRLRGGPHCRALLRTGGANGFHRERDRGQEGSRRRALRGGAQFGRSQRLKVRLAGSAEFDVDVLARSSVVRHLRRALRASLETHASKSKSLWPQYIRQRSEQHRPA